MNLRVVHAENVRPLPAWLIAGSCIAAAWAVSTAFSPAEWYAELSKPSWHPRAWLIPHIATMIYPTLAAALILLLRAPPGMARTQSLFAFGVQLVLGALWAPLMFGLHAPLIAFADALLWWAAALASALSSADVRVSAAWLQMPHLLWVSFALVLNGVIVALNF